LALSSAVLHHNFSFSHVFLFLLPFISSPPLSLDLPQYHIWGALSPFYNPFLPSLTASLDKGSDTLSLQPCITVSVFIVLLS
jgi:hypothetical protein